MSAPQNLFTRLPASGNEESFEVLAGHKGVRIERIVSHGQVSPAQGWYDQDDEEWVVVLRGRATIAYPNGDTVNLAEGDWLHLPAHCRHRVQWTDPGQPTVWLAVHYPAGESS